jgi:hypothetical protein
LYVAAFQAAMVVRRFPALLGQAALGGFTHLRGASGAARLQSRATRFAEAVAVGAGFGLALFATRWVELYGDDFGRARVAVVIVTLAYAATAGAAVDGSDLTVRGNLRRYAGSLGIGLVPFVPLLWMTTVVLMAVARAVALTLLQVGLVLRNQHVRASRIQHMLLTWAIGGIALAAQAMLGRGAAGSLLIWVVAVSCYGLVRYVARPTLLKLQAAA